MCVFALWFYTPIHAVPCWELLLHGFDKSLEEINSVVRSLKRRLCPIGTQGTFWKVTIKCWESFICKDLSQTLTSFFWAIELFLQSPTLFNLSLLLGTSGKLMEGTQCKIETSVIGIRDKETYFNIWNSLCELWHYIGKWRFRRPGKRRI